MAKPRPKAQPEKTKKIEPEKTETLASKARAAARATAAADPALDAFTKALDAFHKRDWAKAAELFEATLAESDRLDLSDRARQYLAATRQKLPAPGAKGKAKADDADPFLRAVYDKNRGDAVAALDLCRKEGRDQKDERFAYLAASIQAAEGRIDEAVQALSRAIELNPKNRVHAFHDSDFAELRKDRDHRQLFGLS